MRATEPYGIRLCYPPPNTGERALPSRQLVYLPCRGHWLLVIYRDGLLVQRLGIPVYSGIFLENMREARQPKMR